MKFVFSLFEGFLTLQQGIEVKLIDPLTGKQIEAALGKDNELTVTMKELHYSYPYGELKKSERSKENILETENNLKEYFLPKIKDEKTVFSLEKEEVLIEEVEYVDSLNDDDLKKLKESVKAARLFNTAELEKKEKEE